MTRTIPQKRPLIYLSLGKWPLAFCFICVALLVGTVAYGQATSFEVTGTVSSSDNGETLPGANVLLKGTTTGAVSNMDGVFNIVVPSANAVLVISSIGYIPQEFTVGNRTTLNV